MILGCPRAKDYEHVRPNAGMVKVMKYDEDLGKWQGKGSPIYGADVNIMAGIRVSMSGDANTMAFIAPGKSDAGPGRVRVFSYVGSDWEQKGESIENSDPKDKHGRAMFMSRDGNNVAIGSPIKTGGGHVRIYRWDDDALAWVQRGGAVPGGGAYHSVGTSVALNTLGEIVAIGEPFNTAKGKTAGRVRVYNWDDDRIKGGKPSPGWALKGQQLDGEEGDTQGFSVHCTGKGNMITIGAPQYKFAADKDHALFNAAVERPLDFDDDENPEEPWFGSFDDEDDEDDAELAASSSLSMLTTDDGRRNMHSVALADVPLVHNRRHSGGGDADGKQYHDPRIRGKDHGPKYLATVGNGRAHVMGCFDCMFLGDITPSENPYLPKKQIK